MSEEKTDTDRDRQKTRWSGLLAGETAAPWKPSAVMQLNREVGLLYRAEEGNGVMAYR